ncbi:N-acetylmuramoyl-L-alanine amidase [Camponotus japonicus]
MIRLYFWITLFIFGIFAQDTYRNVAPTLRECYENRYLLEKDNRLPHTLNTLIAILEKIEKSENLNIDLRNLAVGIMHRFRQDGIEKNPTVLEQSGVLPYRTAGQAQKYAQILNFIPQKLIAVPYNIISDIERCTLHFMLSSSIEIFERGDEGTVCRYADNAYRYARSVDNNYSVNTNFNIPDEVETLTPEQIDVITNHKNGITEDTIDPNALYPELPPNHPKSARILAFPPRSRCPVENGVIKTNWGPVSAGSLIAGIAAGLQPEIVKLSEVFPNEPPERRANLSRFTLDNRWIATLAGDLAEVILMQGPTNEKLSVGVNGNWNSSFVPRWYFLNSNEKLQFTTAEIRGDLDGLILANEIESLYSKIPTLKLSQILHMYYSPRGLLNPSIRACNRKMLFKTLTGNSTLTMQAYSASLVLEEYLHKATMDDNVIERFAMQAVNELSQYIDSSMNKDLSCEDAEREKFNNVQVAIDLTIILDTTWPFDLIQPTIAYILDKIEINQYNSQFTIINGHDSSIIINTTNNILDFGYYNITNYRNVSSGFDFAKLLEKLISLEKKKLDDERHDLGNAKSSVVLIIPYTSSVSNIDKEYCIEQIRKIQEQIPDTVLLILAHGSKDRWSDFVSNPTTDLFSTTFIDNMQGTSTIVDLISRIKQVPQRLINTQCGADYSVVGASNSFIDYIEPDTMIIYRLHPNYFFSSDSDHISTIKIEGSGWGNLKICSSRYFISNFNSTEDTSVSCTSINSNSHTVTFSCNEAGLIHLCSPLYLSIIANSSVTNYQCTDTKVCRFPHMIKYTISYENLVCISSAHINMLSITVLLISMIYIFL